MKGALPLPWMGWPIERILLVFTGVAFLLIFVQVTLFHYRQNFRHWAMYIPVVATPVFGILTLADGFYRMTWLHATLGVLFVVGVVAGGFGSYMHIRGVGQRVGGFKMQNFLVGPPVALPAMISAMSFLGLVVLYWG
jgi:hypothetical protein